MKITKTQEGLVKTGWRLPEHLYLELQDAAERNGRSMNAEVIARMEAFSLDTRLAAIERANSEIKIMLQELLEK